MSAAPQLVTDPPLPPWDGVDIAAMVSLVETAPGHFRSHLGDSNLNGRSYGGQALGQALMAASLTVDLARPATMMSLMFLRGSDPRQPIDFTVTVLQEGKRFSSRHVRATQGDGRVLLDAHATFATTIDGACHGATPREPSDPPESLPDLTRLPQAVVERLRPVRAYAPDIKPCFDFRIPDIDRQLLGPKLCPHLRFWIKARETLPADPRVRAAAFAFLSDWWLNFSSVAPHIDAARDEGLYISSLNHTIWFHRVFSPDVWMDIETTSPHAGRGRGLSTAHVRDRTGAMLATLAQESLIVPMENDQT